MSLGNILNHGLIFRPMEGHQFLGCLMRVELKWHDELAECLEKRFCSVHPMFNVRN